MLYSEAGSTELCDWDVAAKRGGMEPEKAKPGEPRIYNVSAWVSADDDIIEATNVWASELPETARKTLLKDLGLPVKKELVYRFADGQLAKIADFRIQAVWDGWCGLELRLAGGTALSSPVIHSMYLAEMNKAQAGSVLDLEAVDRRNSETDKSRSYYVFDLETTGTDPRTAEICEIAALRVTNDEVVDDFETLVYIDGQMPSDAERVNHISKDMLVDASHMRRAMKEFLDFIGDDAVLVGHNIKKYDLPLIERVADRCGLKFSYGRVIDTLEVAKQAWPGMKSYSMKALRPALDIDAEGAHRALKDCEDEFKVYLRAKADLASGKAKPKQPAEADAKHRRRSSYSAKWDRKKAKEFSAKTVDFDRENPIFEKYVVFSGSIAGHDYDSCMQRVCDLGGTPQDNVTRKTDYLVRGDGCGKRKTGKAEGLRSKGFDIQVIEAEEFCRMAGWE